MSNSYDRREFAKRAVVSSLAVGTAAATSAQETDEPATTTKPLGRPEQLLLDIIRQQYPSEELTPEVLNQIEREIGSHRSRSGVLKSVRLTNGEAPFVFQAYRSAIEDE